MLGASISSRQPTICCNSASPQARQAHPWSWPLDQHLAPEAHQAGRAPARLGCHFTGFLHEPLHLDQAAEVLLVESDTGQCLYSPLEVEQGEGGGHELEDHRTVLDLAA